MDIVSFLRDIRGRITGFNATAAQFDTLQSKLDGLSLSLNSLETSVENVSNRLISNERIDYLQSKLDDLSSSLNTIETSVENVSKRLLANENSQPISAQIDGTIINRIGFLIHSLELINHFACVWDVLPPGSFDVILHGEATGADRGVFSPWKCGIVSTSEVIDSNTHVNSRGRCNT